MRKLIMKMSMSVDGFVSGASGENDWIFKTGDEESKAWAVGLCRTAGLHIMGSKTFEVMASYWPTATGPFASPMNEIPKALFTKKGYKGIDPGHTTTAEQSPAAASWPAARVFDGDLAEGIRELKAEPGKPILAHGGAGFMRSLTAAGLIDEYHLAIHPVALGSGLPIFTDLAIPLYLKLVDVKAFPGGVVAKTYRM
ncbi:MAG TPA: dihydrofolate reductase family protein [Puia sp.]|nr:dihydrofolate reductase family protein [Puia sp.]